MLWRDALWRCGAVALRRCGAVALRPEALLDLACVRARALRWCAMCLHVFARHHNVHSSVVVVVNSVQI